MDVDEVYQALDCLRNAVNYAEGKSLELQAIAFSMIGKILFRCLKQKEKARLDLLSCMRLANSLYPMNV